MAQNTKNNPAQAKGGKGDAEASSKKSLTLTLSFSTVTTFCVVLLGCVCMAFVMGVIVGRGDNPEAHLPQFATLMSDGEEKKSAASDDANTAEAGTPKASQPEDKVMPKEELDYATLLKDKGAQEQDATVPALVLTVPSAAEQALPEQSKQNPAPVPVFEDVPAPKPEPVVFDYVFQVATFTDDASVDRLRERLEGRGLRTKMEKAGKFYKVLVMMRGSAEQAQDLRKTMVDMKLGEPLQRGKKAVQ